MVRDPFETTGAAQALIREKAKDREERTRKLAEQNRITQPVPLETPPIKTEPTQEEKDVAILDDPFLSQTDTAAKTIKIGEKEFSFEGTDPFENPEIKAAAEERGALLRVKRGQREEALQQERINQVREAMARRLGLEKGELPSMEDLLAQASTVGGEEIYNDILAAVDEAGFDIEDISSLAAADIAGTAFFKKRGLQTATEAFNAFKGLLGKNPGLTDTQASFEKLESAFSENLNYVRETGDLTLTEDLLRQATENIIRQESYVKGLNKYNVQYYTDEGKNIMDVLAAEKSKLEGRRVEALRVAEEARQKQITPGFAQ